MGITPDVVCGASMGALVGGAYAGGHLKQLTEWARAADWRAVAALIDVNLLSGGLVDGERIVSIQALRHPQKLARLNAVTHPATDTSLS